MPLSINVGLSRKAAKDYQSTGYSVNITAELDQSLLARPNELQQQIDHLYKQAEQALDRRQRMNPVPVPQTNRITPGRELGNVAGITASQRRAIQAIAQRLDLDIKQEVRDIVGAPLESLSVREASEFIDHLKRLSPSGHSNGGGR